MKAQNEEHMTETDPMKEDFRNFMFHAFKVMGITPHDIQYEVADWLQNAPNRRILSCMRGFGKTVMIACYSSWRFYQDPNRLILVQSASSERAKEIVGLVRQILMEMEGTADLVPDKRDKTIRNQAQRFDIAIRSRKSKDPSLAAYGSRSMITGSHVDEIIADDLETMENSYTDEGKAALMEKIAEYEDVIIADTANIITLIGTPQTGESIYYSAQDLGYEMIRVPAEYPELDDEDIDSIAPFLLERLNADPELAGMPTYPERMGEEYLENKRAITPEARYQLQMLLKQDLADAERYPLKLKDLMVFDCDAEVMPARLVWGTTDEQRLMIPTASFRGDNLYQPKSVDDEYVAFQKKIMWIDPAGKGADASVYTVAYAAPSYIYVPEIGGNTDSLSDAALSRIAITALKHGVRKIYIEGNFGGGAYLELLRPVLRRFGVSAGVEEVHVSQRKEERILDTLRPILGTHRLVFARDVAANLTLQYQLTHLTYDKGCLEHDDYVDSLWGAVSRLSGSLGADYVRTVEQIKEDRLQEMVDAFWAKMGHIEPPSSRILDRYGTSALRRR